MIQISLFDKINQNIHNIHNSESRLSYIIDITLRTRTLTLLTAGLLDVDAATAVLLPPDNSTNQYLPLPNTTIVDLRDSARQLKIA